MFGKPNQTLTTLGFVVLPRLTSTALGGLVREPLQQTPNPNPGIIRVVGAAAGLLGWPAAGQGPRRGSSGARFLSARPEDAAAEGLERHACPVMGRGATAPHHNSAWRLHPKQENSAQEQLMRTSEKRIYITTRCPSAETGPASQTECSSGCTTPLHVARTRQFAPNERKDRKNKQTQYSGGVKG